MIDTDPSPPQVVEPPPDRGSAGPPSVPVQSVATVPQSPVAALTDLTAQVRGLGETAWSCRTPQELVAGAVELERLRSALDALQRQVVAAVSARDAAKTEGWASTKDFLTAITGGRKGAGRRLLALATALSGPHRRTAAALADGAISREQAEAVVAAVGSLPATPTCAARSRSSSSRRPGSATRATSPASPATC